MTLASATNHAGSPAAAAAAAAKPKDVYAFNPEAAEASPFAPFPATFTLVTKGSTGAALGSVTLFPGGKAETTSAASASTATTSTLFHDAAAASAGSADSFTAPSAPATAAAPRAGMWSVVDEIKLPAGANPGMMYLAFRPTAAAPGKGKIAQPQVFAIDTFTEDYPSSRISLREVVAGEGGARWVPAGVVGFRRTR
ncbi:hypothetical protein H9P43_002230 [Blastocladiella emersonii ATCC 22665]|nr:hypothetical protein H9P43_002230 [Blastocladiella emersonii ATCC 22665]